MPSLASSPPLDRSRRAGAQRWQRRSSPLSRYALLAYVLIVVDASLFPFGGWRDLGLGPFDYLFADWPRRALSFDVAVNALGYWPLGFLGGLALHPKIRGVWSIVAVTFLCVALSIGLEAIQTYLPARVASKVDVASNTFGALVGAICAARFAHVLLDTGRLRMWRTRWFAIDASRGLVLVLVWFGALVYPDVFVLGTGGLVKLVDPEWTMRIAAVVGFGADTDAVRAAARFEIAEATVAALTLVGAGLLFSGLLRVTARRSLRLALVATFVVATVCIEALAHAFLFDDASPWPLLTPGSRTGIAIAAVVLLGASLLPWTLRWSFALAALIGAVALVNIYPENPYVNAVGASWTRGKLMNFYGLASGVNLVWPYVAIAYLLRHPRPLARDGRRSVPSPKAPDASSL